MRNHANITMHIWVVSRVHKKVSCVHGKKSVFFILGTLYVVTLRQINEKTLRK